MFGYRRNRFESYGYKSYYNKDNDDTQSFLKEEPQRGHQHVQCSYCSSYTLLKEDNIGCKCASCNAPLKL